MDRTSNTPHGTGGDAVGGDRRFQPPGAVVADRPEQRAPFVEAMPGRVEIVVDQPMGAGVQRQIARLAALAGDFQVRHAFARVPNPQLAQFLAKRLLFGYIVASHWTASVILGDIKGVRLGVSEVTIISEG